MSVFEPSYTMMKYSPRRIQHISSRDHGELEPDVLTLTSVKTFSSLAVCVLSDSIGDLAQTMAA